MNKEELIKKFNNDVMKRPRWLRLLLSIDQFFNVLIWNGSQDETISSNIGRRIEAGKAMKIEKGLCSVLGLFEAKHCTESKGE